MSPTSVRIVLSDRDGRVLMLQRAADDDILPGAWELPGGGIDPGETPAQAAARELREEVGVTLEEVDLSEWGTFPPRRRALHRFLRRRLRGRRLLARTQP